MNPTVHELLDLSLCRRNDRSSAHQTYRGMLVPGWRDDIEKACRRGQSVADCATAQGLPEGIVRRHYEWCRTEATDNSLLLVYRSLLPDAEWKRAGLIWLPAPRWVRECAIVDMQRGWFPALDAAISSCPQARAA